MAAASSAGNEEGDFGFQIAPMVDVVFVLLLFFMASAEMRSMERELTVRLPAGQGETRETVVAIEITAAGQVTMNNTIFGQPGDHKLAALRAWFREAHEHFGDRDPVILAPADDTRQERVVEVLNACRAAGVTKLAFR